MTNKRGFTLIEILVVIAIVGLIGALAAVAVTSARAKQRDATRIAHVRQIQSALEDFFVQNNAYPAGNAVALGFTGAGCLDTDGFQAACDVAATNALMRAVPATVPGGINGQSSCGGAANAYCYTQFSEGQTYAVSFELENAIPEAALAKGLNCATPDGMNPGACPAAQ